MPVDPDLPEIPENDSQAQLYEWQEIWNTAMEIYQSMPQQYANEFLLKTLGVDIYMRIITQMIAFDDIMPKPLYRPVNNDDNDDQD